MIEVQTFNATGDVVYQERFYGTVGPMKIARGAFQRNCGIAINGVDCFTFAEAERAIRRVADTIVEVVQ